MHSSSTGTGFSRQRSEGSGGLFGAAFNLLGDVMASGTQRGGSQRGERRRGQARSPEVEDMAYGEYEEEDEAGVKQRPKGLFGAFAEKILNGQQDRRQVPRRRERSPVRRRRGGLRAERRRQSYTEDVRRSGSNAQAYHDDTSDDASVSDSSDTNTDDTSEDEAFEVPPRGAPRRASTINDASTIKALENAVEHHRREMVLCRRKFDAASKQPMMNTSALQGILNELKKHEQAHDNAKEHLRIARAGMSSNQGRGTQQSRPNGAAQFTRATVDPFGVFSSDPFFRPFFQMDGSSGGFYMSTGSDPLTPGFGTFPFAAFDPIFQGFGRPSSRSHSSSMPRASFTFNGQSNARRRTSMHTEPQFAQPGFSTFTPAPPSPPATLLKPDEAKQLFTTYNQRWTSLAPTDPSIPYPARGHRASALAARDSIWAPTVDAHISTWSEETVMQANAQAFFLGVVNLSPQYNEAPATGKIQMGYNKAKATAAQTKELVDVLKKEKIRWHSDRLGRRNGGASTGPNEALQSDRRARAVFHAVCELMEVAQGS